ncbi:hypothetical protein ABIF97_007199 [Bradyrhizobium japonicum]
MDRIFLAVIVSALLLLTGALGLVLREVGGSDISAKRSLFTPSHSPSLIPGFKTVSMRDIIMQPGRRPWGPR